MLKTMDLPCGRELDFLHIPLVMAIVNCTEDSFYPESHNASAEEACERALRAEKDGAAIIDFGAESTRPGANYISEEEEIKRLIPALKLFRKNSNLPVSIDTRKYKVARYALDAGADIINDISALEDAPEIGSLCAEYGAGIVLMHKKGVPGNMQDKPSYRNVIQEITHYLTQAAKKAEADGIPPHRIILDPGIGFGKRQEDNLDLIAHFDSFVELGYPSLIALSRKSVIGEIIGRPVKERLAGTLSAEGYALCKGAHIIRAHDIPETVDFAKIFYALKNRE
ncbi:MAG: dihydropteroate synthase [Spirochaetaceae bacterium]|jgi:dihydropteroate synthase|nr:dihydropteroate synthase [Spirochaetaceae bacterium]